MTEAIETSSARTVFSKGDLVSVSNDGDTFMALFLSYTGDEEYPFLARPYARDQALAPAAWMYCTHVVSDRLDLDKGYPLPPDLLVWSPEEFESFVLGDVLTRNGQKYQTRKAIEEMAELIIALTKYGFDDNDETFDAVCEEMADAEIVMAQMHRLFDPERTAAWRRYKIRRLWHKLQEMEA